MCVCQASVFGEDAPYVWTPRLRGGKGASSAAKRHTLEMRVSGASKEVGI